MRLHAELRYGIVSMWEMVQTARWEERGLHIRSLDLEAYQGRAKDIAHAPSHCLGVLTGSAAVEADG